MEKREKIAQYAYMYDGDWNRMAKAISDQIVPVKTDIRENYITIFDNEYPECLRRLRYAPWILFYEGDITLLRRRMITIVGSRQMSGYGKKMTELCAGILREKYVLVSGLAKGVDGLVHRCCLKQGKTIGVIGSGLDTVYPSCNRDLYQAMREEHLILSEYPHYVGIKKHHFPWRNRILAALGEAVFVTQAVIKSGTMLTVNEALQLGKEIMVFPYPFDAEEGSGCNKLIFDGAGILYDEAQIRDYLRTDSERKQRFIS